MLTIFYLHHGILCKKPASLDCYKHVLKSVVVILVLAEQCLSNVSAHSLWCLICACELNIYSQNIVQILIWVLVSMLLHKIQISSMLVYVWECLWKCLVEIHGALHFLPLLSAPPPLPLCSLLSQPNQHFASLSWECLAFFWDVQLPRPVRCAAGCRPTLWATLCCSSLSLSPRASPAT